MSRLLTIFILKGTMEHIETPYPISEPSKWWLKSLAIFMAIMIFFMLFQIASGVLTPILIDQVPRDFNELEIYPENGTEQEINDWEESNEFWNETIEYLDQFKNFSKYYAIYGIILFFLGLMAIPTLWSGQRELGIRLTMCWFVIYVISQIHIIMMFYIGPGITPEYNFGSGGNYGDAMDVSEKIWVLISVGQIMLCNTILLAVILFIFSKSKTQTSYDIPSGFIKE
ncbi:MAG: hypothetical protein ACI9O1_000968 [Candidatus Thalassarchaeaceae archaeon]|jgi:hypothetical protein